LSQHGGGSILIRRRGRPAMKLSAALDTSTSRTAICVVNSRDGSVVFEVSVATDPAIIFGALAPFLTRLDKVGHEAGSVAPWLHRELMSLGLPMVLLGTRRAAASLHAQRNKTDKNDARGLAHLVRSGWYRPVHVKSVESHKLRLLLGHRRTLKRKLVDIENDIRHSLKVFGLMVGPRVQRPSFEARVRELVAHDALIAGVTECMLRAWAALWNEYNKLHQILVQLVGLCRRICCIPGVGPVTALTVKAAIDDPRRFVKSKTVAAHFGLTARRIRTGDSIDIEGHISKSGDREVCTVLYEAASAMLVRFKQWCSVKAWWLRIAAKRGHKRAVVAVARKLAVIMHRMWLDGIEFRFAAADARKGSTGASQPTALAAAC
jgi:transposase